MRVLRRRSWSYEILTAFRSYLLQHGTLSVRGAERGAFRRNIIVRNSFIRISIYRDLSSKNLCVNSFVQISSKKTQSTSARETSLSLRMYMRWNTISFESFFFMFFYIYSRTLSFSSQNLYPFCTLLHFEHFYF